MRLPPVHGGQVPTILLVVLVAALASGCLGPSVTPSETIGSSPSPSASPSPTLSPTASPAPSPTPASATRFKPCAGRGRTPNSRPGAQDAGTSANWSGYVAAVTRTGVTCVEGSWIEPTVTCPKAGSLAVAIWVGIDGFSSKALGVPATNVLVQIGTQAECNDGVARHGAWREVLPAEQREVRLSGVIHAGDHISAQVLYFDGEFEMSIFDLETDVALTIAMPAPGAPRRSAEWIVEAPAIDCPTDCTPTPMPRFGTIRFTGADATIAGQRGAIDDNSWTHVLLKMTRAGVTRTTTSPLSAAGTSFGVTWVHS